MWYHWPFPCPLSKAQHPLQQQAHLFPSPKFANNVLTEVFFVALHVSCQIQPQMCFGFPNRIHAQCLHSRVTSACFHLLCTSISCLSFVSFLSGLCGWTAAITYFQTISTTLYSETLQSTFILNNAFSIWILMLKLLTRTLAFPQSPVFKTSVQTFLSFQPSCVCSSVAQPELLIQFCCSALSFSQGFMSLWWKSTGRKNSAVQKQDYEDLSWVLKNTTAFHCLPSQHILTLFHCTSAICSSHGNVTVLLRYQALATTWWYIMLSKERSLSVHVTFTKGIMMVQTYTAFIWDALPFENTVSDSYPTNITHRVHQYVQDAIFLKFICD